MGAMSGVKTVAAAGTEEALGTGAPQCAVAIKALTTNTGLAFVGNAGDGTVSSSTGYPLAAGDVTILAYVDSLSAIMVDVAVNGEGVAFLVLHG
jgi:hypothetical protein